MVSELVRDIRAEEYILYEAKLGRFGIFQIGPMQTLPRTKPREVTRLRGRALSRAVIFKMIQSNAMWHHFAFHSITS